MGSSHPALPLLFLSLLAVAAAGEDSSQDFVTAHNSARAAVGVGPVTWDDEVAAYAQSYANQMVSNCQIVHSGGPYGENIFVGWGRDYSAADAVNYWVAENQYYDYESNTCVPGEMCLHYTQVVWAKTTKIGCAKVTCESGSIFITCNYEPQGNFNGERPYP